MKLSLSFLLVIVTTLFVSAVPEQARSQIVKPIVLSKSTITNVDTATGTLAVTLADISLEVDAVKVSGTVAGTCTLQGSFDGVNWDILNTLTFANQALNRKMIVLPTPLAYPRYRVQFISSGSTSVNTLTAYMLRRGGN